MSSKKKTIAFTRDYNGKYWLSKINALINDSLGRKRLGPVQKEKININGNLIIKFIKYYLVGDIINIRTVEKILNNVDNILKLSKVIINKINKIITEIEDKKEKIRLENIRIENERLEKIRIEEEKKIFPIDVSVIQLYPSTIIGIGDEFKHGTELIKMSKKHPNCLYIQTVEFFDNDNNIINGVMVNTADHAITLNEYIEQQRYLYDDDEWNETVVKTLKEYYQELSQRAEHDQLIETIKIYKRGSPTLNSKKLEDIYFTLSTNNGTYKYIYYYLIQCKKYLEASVRITTKAYPIINKLDSEDQIYMLNDSGTCVYDAFLQYFLNKSTNDKSAKSVYNKLIRDELIYKKSYTDETINEICIFCKSSLIIDNLVNMETKKFNIVGNNRNCITLINTKYNHVDLLGHSYDEPIMINNKEEMEQIKNESSYYIEKFGAVNTIDSYYKVKDDAFKIAYKEWKETTNYNKYFILEDSETFKNLDNYEYNLHSFINDYEIKDSLYDEYDLKKAYFNYSDINYNRFYKGVPSGSFININCNDDFNNDTFLKITSNKMIGFYTIQILDNLDNRIGLLYNSFHLLASSTIELLIEKNIKFKFINASYSPSVDMPFGNKMTESSEELKHYCKAFGLMLGSNCKMMIKIKPLNNDINYYRVIQSNDLNIFNVDGVIYIEKANEICKSFLHIGYYIHAYTKTLILETLLNNNMDHVLAIKLDSIVIKKNVDVKINLDLFKVKETNIQSMFLTRGNNINVNISKKISLLDFGIPELPFSGLCDDTKFIELDNLLYRSFFVSKNNLLVFKDLPFQDNSIIMNKVIFIGGKGGSGKTTSLLNYFDNKLICYTTCCWNLIAGKKKDYNNIIGLSIPNLIGECNNKKTEIIKNNFIKYIIIDEATLLNKNEVDKIIEMYSDCIIFILGDIDEDGFYYQCSINNNIFKPTSDCQYIKYFKNYRFDEPLNKLLDNLRLKMKSFKSEGYKANTMLFNYIKFKLTNNFKEIGNIIFRDNDIGISANNDYNKQDNELSKYFINKGTKPQYYIKTTNKYNGQMRGYKLDEIPTHLNYEEKLFKTIHSFQGLDLNHEQNIIISIKNNFDYNLLYTSLSRARRIDQIIFIKY